MWKETKMPNSEIEQWQRKRDGDNRSEYEEALDDLEDTGLVLVACSEETAKEMAQLMQEELGEPVGVSSSSRKDQFIIRKAYLEDGD